jgi:hypothetical protein
MCGGNQTISDEIISISGEIERPDAGNPMFLDDFRVFHEIVVNRW